MKILIFINLTLYSFFLCSQESSNEYSNQLFIIEGDSIPVNGISLKEVIVFLPLKFESHSDLLNYILLKRKTLKEIRTPLENYISKSKYNNVWMVL